jgi:hypothetical protein
MNGLHRAHSQQIFLLAFHSGSDCTRITPLRNTAECFSWRRARVCSEGGRARPLRFCRMLFLDSGLDLPILLGRHLRSLKTGLCRLPWLYAGARLSGGAARCARSARSAGHTLLENVSRPLERRLVGCGEKSAAIAARIVNKLPLIVVVLLVKYANGLIFTCTGYSHHRTAAEDLSTGGRWTCVRCAGCTGSTGTRHRMTRARASRCP